MVTNGLFADLSLSLLGGKRDNVVTIVVVVVVTNGLFVGSVPFFIGRKRRCCCCRCCCWMTIYGITLIEEKYKKLQYNRELIPLFHLDWVMCLRQKLLSLFNRFWSSFPGQCTILLNFNKLICSSLHIIKLIIHSI